jgi:hypothetical protein
VYASIRYRRSIQYLTTIRPSQVVRTRYLSYEPEGCPIFFTPMLPRRIQQEWYFQVTKYPHPLLRSCTSSARRFPTLLVKIARRRTEITVLHPSKRLKHFTAYIETVGLTGTVDVGCCDSRQSDITPLAGPLPSFRATAKSCHSRLPLNV